MAQWIAVVVSEGRCPTRIKLSFEYPDVVDDPSVLRSLK